MATSVTSAQAQCSTSTVHAPAPLTAVDDVESYVSTRPIRASLVLDIENVHVDDDPRQWSPKLKASILCMAFSASMISGLGASMLTPSIKQIETDLKATSYQISPVLGAYIILQGVGPLLWCPVGEILGRKPIYIASIVISLIGCIAAATAKTIEILIGMRAVQAVGTSSFIAIGAATLADIYDPGERGKMTGIYYAAPLLGISFGPLLGGALTQTFNWRAVFWLLVILLCVNLVFFVLFFRDTFRRERSLTYRRALARHLSTTNTQTACGTPEPKENPASGSRDGSTTVPSDNGTAVGGDAQGKTALSLADVNPFPPLLLILRRRNNIMTLISSALLFALTYSIAYTCSLTLADAYNYDALKIGLVLLSLGSGSIIGSVLGGYWSDRELRRLTHANGGQHSPEMRLESTKPAALFLPLTSVAYGWLAQKHVHISALCISLFFMGFFSIWIYSSTLAYIVDANPGRSFSAVATNSCFRCVLAFIFTLAAVPLENSVGDGGLYTLWGGLLVICELLLLLVQVRGDRWRMAADEWENEKA